MVAVRDKRYLKAQVPHNALSGAAFRHVLQRIAPRATGLKESPATEKAKVAPPYTHACVNRIFPLPVHSTDILKRLKAAGWTEVSVRGSHHKLRNAEGKTVIVPHPKKDLPIGTVRAIFAQAGLEWSKR